MPYSPVSNPSGEFQYMGAILDFLPSDLTFSLPSTGSCTKSVFFLVNGSSVVETHNLTQTSASACGVTLTTAPEADNPRLPGRFAGVVALKNLGVAQNLTVAYVPTTAVSFASTYSYSQISPVGIDVYLGLAEPNVPCCTAPYTTETSVGDFTLFTSQDTCGEADTTTYIRRNLIPTALLSSNASYNVYNVTVESLDTSCGGPLFETFTMRAALTVPAPTPWAPSALVLSGIAASGAALIILTVALVAYCRTAPTQRAFADVLPPQPQRRAGVRFFRPKPVPARGRVDNPFSRYAGRFADATQET